MLEKRADGMESAQRTLSETQLKAFYHSGFLKDQIEHFRDLVGLYEGGAGVGDCVLVDMGGGVGFFAQEVKERFGFTVRVVDLDPRSVATCREIGLEAQVGDVISYRRTGDESIVSFNLILHHLVGSTLKSTRDMQIAALAKWAKSDVRLFVNEYIYESFITGFSSALIFLVTSNKVLSRIADLVSRVFPSLRANTLGVGVRFRGKDEWIRLFGDAGFDVQKVVEGSLEKVDLPLKCLLIRSIRRSSFILVARHQEAGNLGG